MFSTYSELQTAISNWLNRENDTNLDTVIPDFIALAEKRFNRRIRHREMETRATTTISGEYSGLPTGFLEIRRATLDMNPRVGLRYRTPVQMENAEPFNATGQPRIFTVVGDELRVRPRPDQNYTVELIYYKEIPSLSDSNTSNWLLEQYPDIYLFGALVEAKPYVGDDEDYPLWKSRLEESLAELDKQWKRESWNAGPLEPRTDYPLP